MFRKLKGNNNNTTNNKIKNMVSQTYLSRRKDLNNQGV